MKDLNWFFFLISLFRLFHQVQNYVYMYVEMFLEENSLTLRINWFSISSISPIDQMKQKSCNIKIVLYTLTILNKMQQVNKQKRIGKQSAWEHTFVKVIMQQRMM